jgi:hypothetical protein
MQILIIVLICTLLVCLTLSIVSLIVSVRKNNTVTHTEQSLTIPKHMNWEDTLQLRKKEILTDDTNVPKLIHTMNEQLKDLAWESHQSRVRQQTLKNETKSIVLIEPREHHLLDECIQNLMKNLPGWNIHLIGGLKNEQMLQKIASSFKNIKVTTLPFNDLPYAEYNKLLTSRNLWNNVIDTDIVLFTQTDAWICDNSIMNIEDYFIYDYVGAPWYEAQSGGIMNLVGNIGLCLCRTSKMLQVVKEHPYFKFVRDYNITAADLYFASLINNKPNSIVASAFSVENVWFNRPIGVHKPFALEKDILMKLEKHCSGVSILANY